MKPTGKSQSDLRTQAEAQLAAAPTKLGVATPPPDALLHELQVHQIELQMQNAALRDNALALEESRDRYIDLFETAPVGYLTLDAAGVITEINRSGARLIGRKRQNLLNQRFTDFLTGQERDDWQYAFLRALTLIKRQTCELNYTHDDGSYCVVNAECQPSASAPLMLVMLTDVSSLKQALNQLADQEDRLRLAQEATGLGIFDDHLANGGHHFDARLREIWGFDFFGPVSYDMVAAGVHPDDRAAMQANVERALDPHGDGRYHAEYRVVNARDGGLHHVVANGQVFFDHAQPVRFVGTVKDDSEQFAQFSANRERRRSVEQQMVHQVAAQTAAAIAHEINQPLVAISAYSEAALRMLRKEAAPPEKLVRALEGAMAQAQRAGRSLHELLDIIDAGDAASAALNLNELVREGVAVTIDSGFGEFSAAFELDEGLPPVMANRLKVLKVMVNLLHNSIDAMLADTASEHRCTITVRRSAEENMAEVILQDSGAGIGETNAEHVFTPFFSTKADGLGLGLAISRKLIEAQGGRLWADQDAGAGATFHFTLPFAS